MSAVNQTFQVSCKGGWGSPDAPEPSRATPRLIVAVEPEPNGVVGVKSNQHKSVKLLSAVIGVSAVVAMAALGLIFGDVSSAEPEQVVGPVAPQATGQTITTTTPPPAPETSVASPTVTATTPSGFAPAPGP
jgi:hypothetical protein